MLTRCRMGGLTCRSFNTSFCLIDIVFSGSRLNQRDINRLVRKFWTTLVGRKPKWILLAHTFSRLILRYRSLHEVLIVPLWKIWLIMGAPTFISFKSTYRDHTSEL